MLPCRWLIGWPHCRNPRRNGRPTWRVEEVGIQISGVELPLSDTDRTRIGTPRRSAPGRWDKMLISWYILVAEAGFEPVTFRLRA
jgi:hypothetical protein